jgi:hypothetical protein
LEEKRVLGLKVEIDGGRRIIVHWTDRLTSSRREREREREREKQQQKDYC